MTDESLEPVISGNIGAVFVANRNVKAVGVKPLL